MPETARQPELLAIAHGNLKRWMAEPGHSRPYFEEWQRIPGNPLEDILTVIVEYSERMTAMRQCTPLAGVLTPRERWNLYDAFAAGTLDSGSGGDRR